MLTRVTSARPRLLLVDDHVGAAMVLGELLASDGYDTEVLRDGLTAIARLEHGPAFAALLTDFHLPGASGIEICERAAALPEELALFVLTGDPLAVERARDARGLPIEILTKPIDYPDLVARLAATLRRTAVLVR